MQLGWNYPKRKKILDDLFSTTTGRTQTVNFQNKNQDFQKYSVSIDMPKYRLDNGRTYAAQAKYMTDNGLPEDFFSKDPESDQVQMAQHEILKEMRNESGLNDFFKNHLNKQDQAIILSHDGFVINGNRRLASWRELYYSDTSKYAHFSHVDIIILPPADQKDIDELEAKLQVHKDIKADYSWTSLALLLKNRQSSYNYTVSDLSKLFDLSENEVVELFDMLFYAEAYLEDRDKLGQYDLVERAQYAFRQLHKKRSKIKGEPYKEVFERIAFCLIDNNDDGRLYESIPALADHLDKIIENIQNEFDLSEDLQLSEGIELLGGSTITPLSNVIKVASEEKNYDQLREIAIDVIESENIKNKERSKRDFVYTQVKKANTALVEAISAIDSGTKKEGIDAQTKEIEESIEKLRQWLGNESHN